MRRIGGWMVRTGVLRCAVATLAALLLMLLYGVLSVRAELIPAEGYANTGEEQELYDAPSLEAEVVGALEQGIHLDVEAVQGEWARVRYYDRESGLIIGWVQAPALTYLGLEGLEAPGVPGEYEPGEGYESLNSQPLYEKADYSAAVVGGLATGETVKVLENQGDWVRVTATDGEDSPIEGWVERRFIGIIGTEPKMPVTAPDEGGITPVLGRLYYIVSPLAGELTPLYENADAASKVLGSYYDGVAVSCQASRVEADMVQVLIGRVTGYVPLLNLREDPEGAQALIPMMVNNGSETSWLNLRQEPNRRADILGAYYDGELVTLLAEAGEWVHVQAGDVTGYMIRDFLSEPDCVTAAPEGGPTPGPGEEEPQTPPPTATPEHTIAPEV